MGGSLRYLRVYSLIRSFIWPLVGVALLLGVGGARAEPGGDLYLVGVPVGEQSAAELRRGAGAGLRELAVRVSGRSDAERNPALSAAFAGAERYVEQYRYERNASAETGAAPWLLQLRFGRGPVEALLRGAGLPLWGANRPVLQTWLVLEDGGTRRFVDDGTAQVPAALREQLRRRGLELRFPGNFSAASVDEVWQLDTARLAAAAGREALLVGRLAQAAGGWSVAWTLVANGQQYSAEGRGDTLGAALQPAVDRAVDALSPQYAVASGGAAEGLTLHVSGVDSFADYAALLSYLKRLGAVKSVSPLQLSGAELVLQLKIEGGPEQLARQLALESRLTVEATPAAAGASSLYYRWAAPRG